LNISLSYWQRYTKSAAKTGLNGQETSKTKTGLNGQEISKTNTGLNGQETSKPITGLNGQETSKTKGSTRVKVHWLHSFKDKTDNIEQDGQM